MLAASIAAAATLPPSDPGSVGLSKERLERIAPVMQRGVDQNKMSGAVGLVLRQGKVAYFESYGYQDRESKKPMRKDSIFRIYSMTKAVTAVAVMMLYEQGEFLLNDPVSKYLPEFAKVKVGIEKIDPDGTRHVTHTVPAENPITIRDLLRHTSGVVDYFGPKGEDGKKMEEIMYADGANYDLAAASKLIASRPLLHQPGTTFHYGYSIDVLGRLVEVVSGMPFDKYFEEKIFKPIGMPDTAFYVPESKWDRLVTLDAPTKDGGLEKAKGNPQDGYKKPPAAFLGGQGLVSTAMDYARFCQMLLNGGEFEGKRLLGRKTVELMSSDHLGDLPRAGGLAPKTAGVGFGLTFAVVEHPGHTGLLGSAGEFEWGGAAGTRFWIDPKEKMVTVFMINILPHNTTYGDQFKRLVYQAIVD